MAALRSMVFTVPKAGSSWEENEDAYLVEPVPANQSKKEALHCAVSDGATQASFSRLWAQLLVQCAKPYNPSEQNLWKITQQAQELWQADISRRSLPWYAEEKVKKGAFATLTWLSIQNGGHAHDRRWKVVAIGDSNLFIFRDWKEPVYYPIASSAAFHNSPVLLSSRASNNDGIEAFINIRKGKWRPGDQFILTTDALACYLLIQIEDGKNPLDEMQVFLKATDSDRAFEDWVQALRLKEMKNDDTTLVWVWSEEQPDLIG